MKDKKFKLRSNRLYTLYRAMGLDLLFLATYYAIFLKDVKGFTNSELNILRMVSCLIYVVLEPLLIKIIAKLGNTKSIRIGNLIWLVAITFMVFPNTKLLIYFGYTIYDIAFLFKVVEPVILRNNLSIENREDDFSTIEGRTHFIYSVCTAIILLVTGAMFEYNHYSIVYACYVTTTILTILSFLIRDEKEFSSDDIQIEVKESKETKKSSKQVLLSSLVIMIFLCGFLYTGVIENVFSSYSTLLKDEGIADKLVTVYIFLGRISRMVASLFYGKIYKKFRNKLLIALPIILITCLSIIMLTGLFVTNFDIKVIVFVVMIVFIYTLRDPFKLCIQDTIFNYVGKDDRRLVISTNSLFYKIGSMLTNLVCFFVLRLFNEKQYIAFGFMGLMLIETLITSLILYNKLKKVDNKVKCTNILDNEPIEERLVEDMVKEQITSESEEVL